MVAQSTFKTVISFFAPAIAWAFGLIDENFGTMMLAMISLFGLIMSTYQVCVSINVAIPGPVFSALKYEDSWTSFNFQNCAYQEDGASRTTQDASH